MRVVLDSNVVLVCFSERSESYWIAEAFFDNTITLCFTNEMLLEYEEVVTDNMSPTAANRLTQLLLNADNKILVNTYFKFRFIGNDEDDNKFVDCAIAAKAKYLVTEDKHFNILKKIPFPKVEVVNINNFKKLIQK